MGVKRLSGEATYAQRSSLVFTASVWNFHIFPVLTTSVSILLVVLLELISCL